MKMKDTKLSEKDNINPYSLSYSEAVERIIRYSAEEDDAIGYYLPAFVKTPLPHSDPGLESTNWRRYNGYEVMKLSADEDYGFPHSGLSRILIAWMLCNLYKNYNVGRKSGIERNKLNKECRMVFEGSISDLLRELGISSRNGGDRGMITAVKEQLDNIIETRFKWPNNEEVKNISGARGRFLFTLNDRMDWREHRWAETNSFIEISPTLLHLIQNKVHRFSPFPIDLRAFAGLRNSPMAIDLYCWLTRKMYSIIKHPKRDECLEKTNPKRHRFMYSWKALQPQFGDGYNKQKEFTRHAKKAIEKIARLWSHRTYIENGKVLYQGLNFKYHRGRIELLPSPTHVPLDAKGVNFYEYI